MGEELKEVIKQIFNIEEVECHKTYLGLPSTVLKDKRVLFGSIKDKVWNKLQEWKEKLFSTCVKDVLIKAVA